MALAKFRKVHSRQGSGRFVVSEGIAPSEYLIPHDALPTLYYDLEDDRFETVIPQGTLLSLVQDDNGDSRVVPANGSGSPVEYEFSRPADLTGNPSEADSNDTVEVPAHSTVIGAAQYDLYRPFDKGTSQGAGWITHGYVEWPLVANLHYEDTYDPDAFDWADVNIKPGDLIVSDERGRPVKYEGSTLTTSTDDGTGNHEHTLDVASDIGSIVGKVIAVEAFAANFDDGLLSYMQLPSDPGAVKHVFELTNDGPYAGRLGIRANLNVENVIGAFRVNLML